MVGGESELYHSIRDSPPLRPYRDALTTDDPFSTLALSEKVQSHPVLDPQSIMCVGIGGPGPDGDRSSERLARRPLRFKPGQFHVPLLLGFIDSSHPHLIRPSSPTTTGRRPPSPLHLDMGLLPSRSASVADFGADLLQPAHPHRLLPAASASHLPRQAAYDRARPTARSIRHSIEHRLPMPRHEPVAPVRLMRRLAGHKGKEVYRLEKYPRAVWGSSRDINAARSLNPLPLRLADGDPRRLSLHI